MSESRFFEQFIDDYFAESEEHLAHIRRALLTLEDAGASPSAAQAARLELARSLHTVKGLSGMVGLTQAERVAHVLEDTVRAAPAGVMSGPVVEALFQGARLIEQCIATRRVAGTPMPDTDFSAALARIQTADGVGRTPDAPRSAAAGEQTAAADEPTDVVHFQFASSRELAQRGVGVESVRRRLEALGTVLDARPHVREGGGIVFDFWVSTPRDTALDDSWANDGLTWSRASATAPDATSQDVLPSVDAAASRPTTATLPASNLVRVDLERLDDVMRLVGELVVSRSRFEELLQQAANGSKAAWQAIEETNTLMERQLRGLRDGVTRIRLVSLGEVFERLRFAARDVAREQGKEVELRFAGGDTEVDKAIVDRMLEPMMHLVRNAVSHGIESTGARLAAGKPAPGIISLRARAVGDRINIDVEDDGAGIAVERVLARAAEAGIAVEADPSDAALLDVLAAPGFSTRDEADLASGRGIGMAVVRDAVRSLGGELTMHTAPGHGTRFTVDVPLTLMIVDALLVEVGGQRMAVPQPALREILQLEGNVTRFEGNAVISYRGSTLPLVSLRQLFGMPDDWDRTPYLVVVGDAHPTGLVVDRLFGIREIVVHAIADPLVAMPGIGGATELGDGHVSLILDTAAIVRLARAKQEEDATARWATGRSASAGAAAN